jgi:hypothetical protein
MDYVDIPPGSVVARFRDAVYLKNSSVFTSLMACHFIVYKNKAAFDQIGFKLHRRSTAQFRSAS